MTELIIQNEAELKAAYAALLLQYPDDPFKAAMEMFPLDTGKALYIASNWPQDIAVLAEKQKLKAKGGDLAALADKAALASLIWSKMQEKMFPEDFVKVAKLYADVMGFIQKQEAPAGNNINVDNRVMIVQDMGSNQQWEDKAMLQQRELLNVSRSKH